MDETEIPKSAALRVNQIAGPDGILPIGVSTWWAGVKSGRFPQPIKLGPRVTVWRREDVMALLKTTEKAESLKEYKNR